MKIQQGKDLGTYISVSRDEALRIIASLTEQLLARSPNEGRWEFDAEPPSKNVGTYFSIAVTETTDSRTWREAAQLVWRKLGINWSCGSPLNKKLKKSNIKQLTELNDLAMEFENRAKGE